jgi:hypothetical protein
MGILLLIACPVEQLGVELPPGGADAISHEDLRRDVGRLSTEPPDTVFAERMGQMQFRPAAAVAWGSCFVREGRGGAAARLVAGWPDSAAAATGAAALISIAKAWDLDGGPPGPRTLCVVAAGAAAPVDAFRVGPLATGGLVVDAAGAHADPADPAIEAGAIVYTDVQARVKALFAALPGATTPGPTPPAP